ncbi:hypothetical protein [Dokdonella sp.]|uniref:hypothetical protein n=1 Tax=Dokdonella sp. TaxID=2291710 RepID=UPI0037848EB3
MHALKKPNFHLVASNGSKEIAQIGDSWHIPLAVLSAEPLMSQREIICENLVDARYYMLVADMYARMHGVRGITIALRPIGGGGSTTAQMVEAAEKRNESFLAIVDSDKRSVGGAVGDTAKKCLEKSKASAFRKLLLTTYRSIENHIPLAWITKTKVGKQRSDTCNIISVAEQHALYNIRQFAKLKDELVLCKLREDPASIDLLNEIDEMRTIRPETPQVCVGACSGQCKVWSGFGLNLPQQVMDSEGDIRRAGDEGELKSLEGTMELAKVVFEFGMAGQRLRI